MNWIIPAALGAVSFGIGYALFKDDSTHVPLGQSTTPIGQQAQNAVINNHPIAEVMSIAGAQRTLNLLGATPPLQVDGQMGTSTTAALKAFQAKANLSVDGVLGPQTSAALRLAMAQTGVSVQGFVGQYDDDGGEMGPGPGMMDPSMMDPGMMGGGGMGFDPTTMQDDFNQQMQGMQDDYSQQMQDLQDQADQANRALQAIQTRQEVQARARAQQKHQQRQAVPRGAPRGQQPGQYPPGQHPGQYSPGQQPPGQQPPGQQHGGIQCPPGQVSQGGKCVRCIPGEHWHHGDFYPPC